MKKVRFIPLLALSTMAMTGLMGCSNDSGKMKVGLICLHPASSSTYDKNFVQAFKASAKKLGFKAVIRENIPEDDKCRTTAENLASTGCKVIFADSFGHEDYMIEAARKYPNVQFCHATGTQAATAGLANFHNAFASIYEGRYLAGVVAGMKLQSMTGKAHKIGYVAAHAYAEVISGYTSFYLGVKSIVPDVEMDVKYTDSWYHETDEKAAANTLIAGGCVLLSQHADSYGAPTACEEAGIPDVSYNGSTAKVAPETFLVSSRINWSPYYERVVNAVMNAESPELAKFDDNNNFSGGFDDGSVEISELGKNVAPGTAEKVAEVKAALANGSLHVFDINNFTVGGAAPTEENMAPNTTWTFNYPEGTEFIKDGYYHESEYRSAPSFDVIIDGIHELGHMHPQEN